tara:strand:- start:360 stop:1112 length:753 start_codon:yes stop_codon:yes gene_type:complete
MFKRLILLRHGQSKWNLENRFTGWTDIELTKKGEDEAKKAGLLISQKGFGVDLIYTSFLKRAIRTGEICSKELINKKIDFRLDWRLNERHYGNLQGLNKLETANKFGADQVLLWRRSYDISPPKMDKTDERHPLNDALYKNIDANLLPSSESLKDTLLRVKPLLKEYIFPEIKKGKNLIIVAHGNSLRAIVKFFKRISNDDIVGLNIPTGAPYVMELDKELQLIDDYYLGNENEILKMTEEIKNQGASAN